MSNTAPSTETQVRNEAPSRFKRYLGIAGLVLIALGGCYLAGWLQGRKELGGLQTQLTTAHKEAEAKQDECARQLTAEQRTIHTLEARRNLDQSLSALDARNFGIAEQQIKKAAKRLVAARAEGATAEVAKALEAYRLTATEDLGPQRKQLVDWISQIDSQLVVP
jgi:hypothetical protein